MQCFEIVVGANAPPWLRLDATYKHGFSVDNKHEILGESEKKLIQQIYGKPVTERYYSKFANVTVKQSPNKYGKVKVIFIFKPKRFGEHFDENF